MSSQVHTCASVIFQASLLSVADLQTVLLRKPTRASALLVWIADRMLDLCGRVSNAHPYLDKVC